MVDEDLVAETTQELYAVDPADFVAARTDLVRRLRAEGQRDLAVAVGKLRRPSPAAWAVNQLVRRAPQGVEELLRRGEELREAQDLALAGAHPDDLREAAGARREAVAALTDTAVGFLAARGASPDAHRQQIEATLEAATLDPRAAAAVQAGRLTAALEPPSGFGDLGALLAASTPAPTRRTSERRDTETKAERAAAEARRRAKELTGKARAQAEKVARLRRELGEADAEVTARERRLAEARQRRDELAERLAAAEEAGARAEAEAAEAEQAAARA